MQIFDNEITPGTRSFSCHADAKVRTLDSYSAELRCRNEESLQRCTANNLGKSSENSADRPFWRKDAIAEFMMD